MRQSPPAATCHNHGQCVGCGWWTQPRWTAQCHNHCCEQPLVLHLDSERERYPALLIRPTKIEKTRWHIFLSPCTIYPWPGTGNRSMFLIPGLAIGLSPVSRGYLSFGSETQQDFIRNYPAEEPTDLVCCMPWWFLMVSSLSCRKSRPFQIVWSLSDWQLMRLHPNNRCTQQDSAHSQKKNVTTIDQRWPLVLLPPSCMFIIYFMLHAQNCQTYISWVRRQLELCTCIFVARAPLNACTSSIYCII